LRAFCFPHNLFLVSLCGAMRSHLKMGEVTCSYLISVFFSHGKNKLKQGKKSFPQGEIYEEERVALLSPSS